MKRKIKVRLSEKGIDKALEQLEEIKLELLQNIQTLCANLAREGFENIQARYYGGGYYRPNDLGQDLRLSVDSPTPVDENNNRYSCMIRISGEDFLGLEFGIGPKYNSGAHGSLGGRYDELAAKYTGTDPINDIYIKKSDNGYYIFRNMEAYRRYCKDVSSVKLNEDYIHAYGQKGFEAIPETFNLLRGLIHVLAMEVFS